MRGKDSALSIFRKAVWLTNSEQQKTCYKHVSNSHVEIPHKKPDFRLEDFLLWKIKAIRIASSQMCFKCYKPQPLTNGYYIVTMLTVKFFAI